MPSKKEEAEERVQHEIDAGIKREMKEGSLKTRLQCRKRAHSEVEKKFEDEQLSLKQQLLEQVDQSNQATMELQRASEQGNS